MLLARKDVELNIKDKSSRTALHYAVQTGVGKLVSLLVARDDVYINIKDEHSKTALHFAVMTGFADIVSLVLARKDLAINVQDGELNTALHAAAKYSRYSHGQEDIVKLLLDSWVSKKHSRSVSVRSSLYLRRRLSEGSALNVYKTFSTTSIDIPGCRPEGRCLNLHGI
ncbi:ankyrin repeat-containing domain protein [Exophiala viscosa]|uniref:ankyrin repeat-containing domain protein n=1 Tax=Exophiala viscosa TaxID=2486360 RepID=UPI0021A1D05A|nr:ankyrin repeat-containing domain protein [Exophiala viscosa]